MRPTPKKTKKPTEHDTLAQAVEFLALALSASECYDRGKSARAAAVLFPANTGIPAMERARTQLLSNLVMPGVLPDRVCNEHMHRAARFAKAVSGVHEDIDAGRVIVPRAALKVSPWSKRKVAP